MDFRQPWLCKRISLEEMERKGDVSGDRRLAGPLAAARNSKASLSMRSQEEIYSAPPPVSGDPHSAGRSSHLNKPVRTF